MPTTSQPASASPPTLLSTSFPPQPVPQPGPATPSTKPPSPALPAPPFPIDAPTARLCQEATAQVERALRLPEDFLSAISRVETGRMDKDGTLTPWPWSLNVAGRGYFYSTREEAITAARAFLQQGMRSMDVGCLQVNLLHHPNAFPSLEAAFDPYGNARYGGIFLQKLRDQTGSWPHAAAAYHSQNSNNGTAYLQRVLQQWATPQHSHTQPDHSLSPNALPTRAMTRTLPITTSTAPNLPAMATRMISPTSIAPATKTSQTAPIRPRDITEPAAPPRPSSPKPILTPPTAGSTTPHPYDHRQFRPFRGLFRPAMPPPPHQRMKSQNGRNLASYRAMPIHPDHTMPYASAY